MVVDFLRQNGKDQLYGCASGRHFFCLWDGQTSIAISRSPRCIGLASEGNRKTSLFSERETTSLILTMALRRPPTRVELKADDIEEYHEVSTRF